MNEKQYKFLLKIDIQHVSYFLLQYHWLRHTEFLTNQNQIKPDTTIE